VKRICVFCGSSTGGHPGYADAARELATEPLLTGRTPAELLDRVTTWRPPALPRAWLDPTQI
jgi:hypothetical protein